MKIIEASNPDIALKISQIWSGRAFKIRDKIWTDKAIKLSTELLDRCDKILQLGDQVFSKDYISTPKKKANPIKILPPKSGHPSALIDKNGTVWSRTHTDDWFDNGKFQIRIIDYSGYKVIMPGEPMPIIKIHENKRNVKNYQSEKIPPPRFVEERRIDRTAFDDLKYEGFDY